MSTQPAELTVYYDGACPLCLKEIGLMRQLDRKRGRILFEDVSPPDAAPSCGIDRKALMARFHAKLPDGSVVDGAQAFTEAWGRISGLFWLRPIGRFGPTRWLLNFAYAGFLKIRPFLQQRLKR
jgi:predicted DCC family thiol-disulfide oxidoreductase YuxK